MGNLLYTLYEALGLESYEIAGESPTLTIDEDIVVYFDENHFGLKMICPVGPLPENIAQLQDMLRWNYENNIILAASEAGHDVVLALYQAIPESTELELTNALDNLITHVRAIRTHFYCD